MVILSVLAKDCQNSASINFCRRFSLAFLMRRAFLEDDNSRKSTFFGFDGFFFLLIFVTFTEISFVLINQFFLGVTRIQIGYTLHLGLDKRNDKCIRGAYSLLQRDGTKPDMGCVHNKPVWEKMVGSCRQ